MKETLDDIKRAAVQEAGRQAAKGALEKVKEVFEDENEEEARSERDKKIRKLKLIALGIGGLFAVFFVFSLIMGLWKWIITAGILGGVGLAGYLYLRPKLGALVDRFQAKKRAKLAAKAEADAKAAAEKAKADKAQALEDDLARLKAMAATSDE